MLHLGSVQSSDVFISALALKVSHVVGYGAADIRHRLFRARLSRFGSADERSIAPASNLPSGRSSDTGAEQRRDNDAPPSRHKLGDHFTSL